MEDVKQGTVQRAAAALVPHAVRDRGFLDWLPKLGVSNVNSQILSGHDYLVVFADFYFVPAGTRFWEFTGIDANGNESGPLETELLDQCAGPTINGLLCGGWDERSEQVAHRCANLRA